MIIDFTQTIANNIINSFHNNKNAKITYDFKTMPYNNKLKILHIILNNIMNGNMIINMKIIKNFKLENYYILFEYIIDNFLDNNDNKYDKSIYCSVLILLLSKLTILNKGQYLLEKLKKIILYNINNLNINDSFIIASQYGTLLTFKFWSNIKEIDNNMIGAYLINSIANSDDRLYKYLLQKILDGDKLYFQKNNIIKDLLIKLSKSSVPTKYVLKRIKLLSTKVSLHPYFILMIHQFKDPKIIIELHKYYYVISHIFNNLVLLYNILSSSQTNINILFYMLKTEEEKMMLNIIIIIYNNGSLIDNSNKLLFETIVINNYINIIKLLNWKMVINKNTDYENIIKILCKNNLIHKFLYSHNIDNEINNLNIYMLFLTRFFIIPDKTYNTPIKKIIIINFILHKLRILAKKKVKSTVINYNIKMYDILKEIKTFSPNNKKNILINGSLQYQYDKQRFTNLPPRHLLPGEIHYYNNFLIKEKADGILINNLPIGIFPNHEIIMKYQVKAEYIEDIDLYLIFDIEIPNTTIIERYNFLRNSHYLTKHSSLKQITNLNDFFDILDIERDNINYFLNYNKDQSIKWYPKFSCLVNDSQINSQLIQEIILNKELCRKLNHSDPYNCDGLILTPIDGSREIKIKPLTMMTIDVMFKQNKWVDRDNNDLTNIIISNRLQKDGKIYRCKPILLNDQIKFAVDTYRYDKKRPNPSIVINSIYNILKYDWNLDIIKTNKRLYYYDKPKRIISNSLISMFKSHYDIILDQISKLKPSINQNWLDLGCGKGKLIKAIKKYNPKLYLGLDIDIDCLIKCLKYHDEYPETYIFNKCELGENWDKTSGQWFSYYNIKYDYIIANFSLMHFFTDLFWDQLNQIVSIGTKFIFNLVTKPININEWSEFNSFLRISDELVTYKFEWVHNEIKTEPFISEDKLMVQLKKSGWVVINKFSINSKQNSLSNFYTWWIIEKI